MKTFNNQFGELEFEEKHVISFPEGMIGFRQCTKYILINDTDTEPFRWLVSIEEPDLCFPLLDPALLVDGYENKIKGETNAAAFVVATLHDQPEHSTVNLKSPVIIENETQFGKQIVIEDETMSLRHPFLKRSTVQSS